MGAVGIEDLALSVKAGEPRPGQRIGKEAPPAADIDGGTVLEEVLPYLIVVAASQAPSEGVQAARPGDVPLGLESTSNRARSIVVGIVISKTDAAVDKDGMRTVSGRTSSRSADRANAQAGEWCRIGTRWTPARPQCSWESRAR